MFENAGSGSNNAERETDKRSFPCRGGSRGRVRLGTQQILRDIVFQVPRGQTLAIIGETWLWQDGAAENDHRTDQT